MHDDQQSPLAQLAEQIAKLDARVRALEAAQAPAAGGSGREHPDMSDAKNPYEGIAYAGASGWQGSVGFDFAEFVARRADQDAERTETIATERLVLTNGLVFLAHTDP